jgi:hypothetical protein
VRLGPQAQRLDLAGVDPVRAVVRVAASGDPHDADHGAGDRRRRRPELVVAGGRADIKRLAVNPVPGTGEHYQLGTRRITEVDQQPPLRAVAHRSDVVDALEQHRLHPPGIGCARQDAVGEALRGEGLRPARGAPRPGYQIGVPNLEAAAIRLSDVPLAFGYILIGEVR